MDLETRLREIAREEAERVVARATAQAKPKEYMSVGEAADHARVAPATVRRWCREGRLGEQCRAGRHRRVKRADLERMMRRGAVGASSGELTDAEIDRMARDIS